MYIPRTTDAVHLLDKTSRVRNTQSASMRYEEVAACASTFSQLLSQLQPSEFLLNTQSSSSSNCSRKITGAKDKTVAALLEAEFPRLPNDGKPDMVISSRTMAYVQFF